jgi:hypothetical protein
VKATKPLAIMLKVPNTIRRLEKVEVRAVVFNHDTVNMDVRICLRLFFIEKEELYSAQYLRQSKVKALGYTCTYTSKCLTLSPPAVKTQCLSQCQAFQRLVTSSHTLVNGILNNF